MSITLSILVVTNEETSQQYTLLSAMKVYPLITAFILRDTNPIAWGFSWALCLVVTLLANGAETSLSARLADTVSYGFTTSIVLYDTYRQNVNVFRLVTKLQETLKENEQLAVEAQALELRAMIGNVAHDLKTVSAFCYNMLLFYNLNSTFFLFDDL